ncbi:MAG: NAD(+) synthase [Proteobacteria bacterium]|nr:NAD(+) synthase [Pseudomonadota bacterium]
MKEDTNSKALKYAISSLNPVINDWHGQVELIRNAIEQARQKGARLLVLPELSIGAPDGGDIFLRPQSAVFAEQCLSEIAPMTAGLTLICGTIFAHDGKLYNAAAVFHDRVLTAVVPKRYPEERLAEERWFARWDYSRPAEQHLGALFGPWTPGSIPEIPNLYVCPGDIELWPDLPENALCAQVLCRPFVLARYRDDLKKHLAISHRAKLTILRANCLGCDDGTHIYDGGGYIISNGTVVALSPRFSFQNGILTTSQDKLAESFDPSLAEFEAIGTAPKSEEDYMFAELELALCLGLNDYLVRAHIDRLCLALSGGRDSAMIAVLAARMMQMRHPDESLAQIRDRMKDFLYCAYLPSAASSSSGTQDAAIALAEHFGFSCPIIPIGDIAAATRQAIESTLGRTLTWEKDDLTLQNVQARTRSSIIWMLANAHNAMLLTTGNMSEAAVGYATMDGDSSGCLDPIGNIPKTLVSSWLEWARKVHEIPALDLVFAQPPSAELRPVETKQTDEGDLMPYPVLDAYIDWFIARKHSPKDVFALAKTHLRSFYTDDDAIRRDIRKFVTMAPKAQWKRIRFANGFSVMPYGLDTEGLKWPCLMNGFTQALNEL